MKTISDHIFSSRFYKETNDSLKDEDNVAWVMKLPEDDRDAWITILQWIRAPDRLLERDTFAGQKYYPYTFESFRSDWRKLRRGGDVGNSPFASLFEKLKERWERESLSEKDLRTWDLYLESLKKYVKPDLVIHDEEDYRRALYGLSGTFFQALPFVPPQFRKEVGYLGMLDQFYNNMRDLYEDSMRKIFYFPGDLLRIFGLSREELEIQIINPDIRFVGLNDYLLNTLVPVLVRRIQPLLFSNLPPSWEIMLDNNFSRYQRIERVFKNCGYNAELFSTIYWDYVRQDLDPGISRKFREFKSTLTKNEVFSSL